MKLGGAVTIIIVLAGFLLGLAIRVTLILGEDDLSGDAVFRYDPIARNLASGNGFSKSAQAPYLPDDFDQPLYPLLIAAIYRLFDFSITAVRLIQGAIELATLWLVWRISILLGLTRRVGLVAVMIGLVCPFLPLFTGRLLTEVAATFLLAVTGYLLLMARDRDGWWWLAAGGSAGAGLLARPDLLISLSLMISAMLLLVSGKDQLKKIGRQAALVLIGIILIMVPWCYRNYTTFGQLRPLGGVTSQTSLTYVKWLGTWVDNPRYQQDFWWGIWERGKVIEFPTDKLSDQQISAAGRALKIAGDQGSFEGEPDMIFTELTDKARRSEPFKVFIWLPLKRTAMAWLRMPGYLENARLKIAAYGFWLLFLLFSALGLAVMFRENTAAFMIIGSWVAGRTVLPVISVLAIEPRYQIEALPACLILASSFIVTIFPIINIEKSIE